MLSNPTRDARRPLVILAVLVLLVGLGLIFYRPTKPTVVPPQAPTPNQQIIPPTGAISLRGVIVCLPHKDMEGPHTLECAFGLRDESGRFFGLRDTDPTYKNISSAPMNTPVYVTGTFTPKDDMKYQSIGNIEVTEIRQVSFLQTETASSSR